MKTLFLLVLTTCSVLLLGALGDPLAAQTPLQWHVQNSGVSVPLYSVTFPSAEEGWAAGASGTLLHTLDSGRHWEKVELGSTANLHSVYFNDIFDGAVAGDAGTIFYTTDGEILSRSTLQITNAIYGVHFPTEDTGYAVGSGGVIYKTIDSGRTWAKQSGISTSDLRGVNFIDAENGWAVGASGTAFYTTDGGAHWNRVLLPTVQNLNAVAFASDQSGWIVGTNTILTTTDGGANWRPTATTADLRSVYASDSGAIAVGLGGACYLTLDGKSWLPVPLPTTSDLYAVASPTMEDAYIAGDNGLILSTVAAAPAAIEARPVVQSAAVSAYPNPVTDRTSLSITLPSASSAQEVYVRVLDMLGREVFSVKAVGSPDGAFSTVWDANDLPSGTYFYQMLVGGVPTASGKLVKL